MAIAYVQQQGQTQQSGGSATIALNLGATFVAGNVIVVWTFASGDTLASMSAVTGITWTLGATGLNAASNAAVGLAVGLATSDVASGTTITANLATAGSTRRGMVLDEFSGVDTTTPLQTSNVASGTAAAAAAPSITTTGSGLLLVSSNCMNNGGTITDMLPPTTPGTFIETNDQNIGASSFKRMTCAYLLGQSGGTYAPAHAVGTGTQAAAEGGAGALNPLAAVSSTVVFDELSYRVMGPGPTPAGPQMFYEPWSERIFTTPPGVVTTRPQRTIIGVGT